MLCGSTGIKDRIFRDRESTFRYESDDCIVRKYRLSRPLIAKWMNFSCTTVGTLYQLTIGTNFCLKWTGSSVTWLQMNKQWYSWQSKFIHVPTRNAHKDRLWKYLHLIYYENLYWETTTPIVLFCTDMTPC